MREEGKGWDYQQKKGTHKHHVAEREDFTTMLQKSPKKDLGTPTASWGSESGFPSWKEHRLWNPPERSLNPSPGYYTA